MSTNNIITTDLQNLEVPSALIELFEVELTDSIILRFHAGVNEILGDLSFDGNDYIPLPIMIEGIEIASDGAISRPSLTIANVHNVFKSLLNSAGLSFDGLVGKRVTRRQTLEMYLDDAAYELPKHTFLIDRIAEENALSVKFELTAPYDVSGIRIPNRVVVGKYCSWIYQGRDNPIASGGCSWRATNSLDRAGTQYFVYFDSEDRPLLETGSVSTVPYGSNHSIDTFVEYNNNYWRSEASDNSTTPSGSSILWKQVFFWSDWVATPQTPYAVGSYVRHDNIVWKCLILPGAIEPASISLYWKRVDYCGKTLNSCKCRFQFTPTSEGASSASKDTSIPLPFGGFPGSVKFN